MISVPAKGRVAVPAQGDNRAPPPAPFSETNNECQIKFELIHLHGPTAGGHPLERPGDSQSHRHFSAFGAAHLGELTNCGRIGCAPSSASAIQLLSASSVTSSGSMSSRSTQPGLPIKSRRCKTMTHDYKRHGTTTLFAALSVLDRMVIVRGMQRHRHLEFIPFRNAVERPSRPTS